MRYQDGADVDPEEVTKEEVHGFVFYYPTISVCKVIELVACFTFTGLPVSSILSML